MVEKALTTAAGRDRSTEHWTGRLHEVCSVVCAVVALNLLWLAFTLLGGIVLGIAPASVAVAHCVREHGVGRSPRLAATFAGTWRAEMVGANLVMLPYLLLTGVVVANYVLLSAAGPAATAPRLATLAGLLLLLAVGCWLPGLYVHYDLSRRRFLLTALRVTLARPLPSLLMLFLLAGTAYASYRMPILVVLVSIGAWLCASSWLSLRFFAENEARLATTTEPGPSGPDHSLTLPSDPLRTH